MEKDDGFLKIIQVGNIIEEGKLGGPQIRMIMVAAKLKNTVSTIIVMPNENSLPFQKKCMAAGICYKIKPITRITKELNVLLRYIFFSPFEVLLLSRLFKKNNFEVIHVSGGSWQYKGVIAGKLAGTKVLWHLNDTSMPSWIQKIFSIMSRFSDGFIFASERSREYYGTLVSSTKPEFVIPAPVDVVKYDPDNNYEGDAELVNQWKGELVIGTTANINPVKGIEIFVRAASLVTASIPAVRFVVVGPVFNNQKKYFHNLKELCNELGLQNIDFVGGRSDIRALLKRFDIYVCSSYAESSPLSVWEAMSMAKPVVSTNVGDVPLYVKDRENGFVVDTGNFKAIADRVEKLCINRNLRNEFGQKARNTAINSLDISICAQKHIDAYKAIINT